GEDQLSGDTKGRRGSWGWPSVWTSAGPRWPPAWATTGAPSWPGGGATPRPRPRRRPRTSSPTASRPWPPTTRSRRPAWARPGSWTRPAPPCCSHPTSPCATSPVGPGLGGGVGLGGELVRGAFGAAAEVGHLTLVPHGRPCGCGNAGCWEQYASGRALVTEARERAPRSPTSAGLLLELAGGQAEAITGPMVTM